MCVRLTPIPPAVRPMLFDFGTVEDCAATVSGIIASGVVPAAVEMMDRGIVVAAEGFAHAGYPTDAAAILIVEVDGTPAAVEAQAAAAEAAARANRTRHTRIAADDAERALIWEVRKNAFGAVATIAPHYHLHDCVVPRTMLAEVLAGVVPDRGTAPARRHQRLPCRRRQPPPRCCRSTVGGLGDSPVAAPGGAAAPQGGLRPPTRCSRRVDRDPRLRLDALPSYRQNARHEQAKDHGVHR